MRPGYVLGAALVGVVAWALVSSPKCIELSSITGRLETLRDLRSSVSVPNRMLASIPALLEIARVMDSMAADTRAVAPAFSREMGEATARYRQASLRVQDASRRSRLVDTATDLEASAAETRQGMMHVSAAFAAGGPIEELKTSFCK